MAVGVCAIAVVVCYYWVDRPVAFFVHEHAIAKTPGLVWLTYSPPIVQTWSPLILVALIARRACGPWRHWQSTLIIACVGLIVADQFRESLGEACGRYWPETWHDNNPSLIGNGTYGFRPFQSGDDTGSFPSGHAARILSFVAVLWLGVPSGRLVYTIVSLPMLLALVAMNYHFVSDVIAGSVLGGVVGAYAATVGGIEKRVAGVTAP
jgi:membrane-associated phospholipid phosphatase